MSRREEKKQKKLTTKGCSGMGENDSTSSTKSKTCEPGKRCK